MMNILQKIRNLLKLAKVDSTSEDTEQYPTIQVSYNGKSKKALLLTPYGLACRPPDESLVFCMNVLGQETTMFAIPNDYANRFKNLKKGEVATGNYMTTARTFYDADGNAVVFGTANTALAGATVYIGTNDGATSLLTEISNALANTVTALENVSTALNEIATVATYPTSVGPTGTMLPPSAANVETAKTNIDTAKATIETAKSNIDSITGSAPNVS